jgi:hypothetical protein
VSGPGDGMGDGGWLRRDGDDEKVVENTGRQDAGDKKRERGNGRADAEAESERGVMSSAEDDDENDIAGGSEACASGVSCCAIVAGGVTGYARVSAKARIRRRCDVRNGAKNSQLNLDTSVWRGSTRGWLIRWQGQMEAPVHRARVPTWFRSYIRRYDINLT